MQISAQRETMRTTLDLNGGLLLRAKAYAAEQRTTLTKLIEEGLALRLRTTAKLPENELEPLVLFSGGSGLREGIDPTRNQSLMGDDDLAYDLRQARLGYDP